MPSARSIESRFLAPLAVSVCALTAVTCKKVQSDVRVDQAEPAASGTTHSAELGGRRASAPLETVAVDNDRSVLVAIGDNRRRPIVYLHGMCTEPRSDLEAWSSGVSAYGTVIALSGDAMCPGQPGMATWTMDVAAIDRRIDGAIAAVRAARGVDLDANELIVIGESMGASRAEALAGLLHAKYTRLVLVGAPETPSTKTLERARAIALVAGEKEPHEKVRRGVAGLESAGLKVRFWELPGASHGSYGPEGARVMGEAVASVAGR